LQPDALLPVEWFVVAAAFAFGTVLGSFANVAIYRLPREGLRLNDPPRSFCPACRHTIAWYDNVPLLSFILLLGRCRHCGAGISPRYPAVEGLCGVLFALSAYHFALAGQWMTFLVSCAFCLALVIVTFVDLEFRIIPDAIDKPGMLLAPVLSFAVPGLHVGSLVQLLGWLGRSWGLSEPFSWSDRVLAAASSILGVAVGAALTYAVGVAGKAVFRKEAMGFGDVKLMGMIGGILGWQAVIMTFFLGSVIGAFVGVGLGVFVRRRDPHIPFGPFLASAAVLILFHQAQIRHFFLVTYPRWLSGL
jgi:leader peptidase (prepilin peptidase)/N-methyltransferase